MNLPSKIARVRISIDRAFKLACMWYLSPVGVKYVIDDRLPPAVTVYEFTDGSCSILWARTLS